MLVRKAVAALGAVAVVVAGALPAAASTTGKVTFECEANMPAWPTPAATGTCGSGTAPAWAFVSVSGVAGDGQPYTVTGLGIISAVFEYANACVANEIPLLGAIRGQATIIGLVGVHGAVPVAATLTTTFSATYTAANFTFTTTGHRVVFSDGWSADGSVGAGNGDFVPLLSPNNHNVCPAGGPLRAQVEGKWKLAL